jgi:hypothetical protein
LLSRPRYLSPELASVAENGHIQFLCSSPLILLARNEARDLFRLTSMLRIGLKHFPQSHGLTIDTLRLT